MCLSLRSPRDARLCGGRDIFTPSQGQAVSDSDLRLVVARFDSDRDAAFNLVRTHIHPPKIPRAHLHAHKESNQ